MAGTPRHGIIPPKKSDDLAQAFCGGLKHPTDVRNADIISHSWGASLVLTYSTLDHYHLSSNLGVGLPEGCFISDFTSLPLEVARPI